MKVHVVSKEIIKPSKQTPPHLRNFKLSFLDQLLPPFYFPVVVFYSANDGHESNNNDQRSKANILKKSLSETLTRYYPIAGRVRDNIFVECNDQGVDYIEAKVNAVMFDFMNVDVVHQLHPSYIVFDDVAKEAQLAVQVNLFNCGGIAISVCLSHKIADGSAQMTFLNSWAATAGLAPDKQIVYPTFDSAAIFPALPPGVHVSSLESDDSLQGKNVVTKQFLFSASKITALRARIATESRSSNILSKHPTRTEAVSALVWKSFMETSRVQVSREFALSTAGEKPIIRSKANFAVNLRTRLNPPLPQPSFGNIMMYATAESTVIDHDENTLGFAEPLHGFISQLRLGVSKINDMNTYGNYKKVMLSS
ncbi:salutaridinol 7-O-acetyltransferase-like [Papaver somniferum]|uniref:salutaridinol 7-O-acetyltransferase-like n=1 Tax=Papaver somniferum TaxID=3469 RepID=UPI000E6F7D3A|nr:salutaridinol 7-O-acetyltransferase-like [Papaver somniferum]